MMRSRTLASIAVLIVLVSRASGTCTQCGAIRVTLDCPMNQTNTMPVKGTGGLVCDVIKDKPVNLTCDVDALHTGKGIKYEWVGSGGLSSPYNFTKYTTWQISVNISADVVVYCIATVSDIYGTYHKLHSNSINIKAQSYNSTDVTTLTGTKTIANGTHYTELKCTIPSAWYPEPDVLWEKDGKPGTPEMEHMMIILTKDVGTLKKGSLILHGVGAKLAGQYTCNLLYKYRHPMSKEMKPMKTLAANYTVKLASGTLSPASNTTIKSGAGAIWPSYVGPGIPVIFNCLAVGGNTSGNTSRLFYKWSRIGSDYGVKLKNVTNSMCMKGEKGGKGDEKGGKGDEKGDGKKEKRGAGGKDEGGKEGGEKEEGPDPCWFVSTNKTSATVDLMAGMNMMKYGIEMHPLGHWISFPAAYSEIAASYQCAVSLTNTSSATTHTFKQPPMLGGIAVDTGSTCGYTSDKVALPLMDYMTNFSANGQPEMALPTYTDFSVYNNGSTVAPPLFSVYKVNELTLKSLPAPGLKNSNCSYYQVKRAYSTVSAVVKTILVQNLGPKGSNVYNQSNYHPSRPNITITYESKTQRHVECVVNGNGSVAEWVTDCDAKDTYSVYEKSNKTTCGWVARIQFNKNKMQHPCMAWCLHKSQCTEVLSMPFKSMPSECKVPSLSNGQIMMKEHDVSGKIVFANDMMKPMCKEGWQLEGPSFLTCGTNGELNSNATKCTDLRNSAIKCPTLEAGQGSLQCDTASKTCTYTCQANTLYSNGTSLVSTKKVTCDDKTAVWSHMSKDNPTGTLPTCAEPKTPSGILTTATIEVSGTGTCPSDAKIKAAVIVTLKASSDQDYDCMDNGNCTVASVTCSASSASKIQLKIVVNQTKSTTNATISTNLASQLSADAKAKTFSISVTLSKKKRAATTLAATGTVSVTTSSSCPAGSGSVGTTCITCAAGTYVKSGVCTSCPLNTYSSSSGQTSCTNCPSGLKTYAVGQDSETDCSNNVCSIAKIDNGITSPSSGWTVKASTMVTTFCNDGYSVGFGTEEKQECGSVARCLKKCLIKKISPSDSQFTDTKHKVGAKIENGEEASLKCDTKTVSKKCTGDELELSCSGSKVALIVGLCCVALLVVVAMVMSAVVINKRNKRPEKGPSPLDVTEPKVMVEAVAVFRATPEPNIYTSLTPELPMVPHGSPPPESESSSIMGALTEKLGFAQTMFNDKMKDIFD